MMIGIKKSILAITLATASLFAVAPEVSTCFKEPLRLSDKQLHCLATNVYHEARGESWLGQVMVARVTLNRAFSEYWPNSICGVVYQYKQFSWTLNPKKIKDAEAYNIALNAARAAVLHASPATHFHTTKAHPKWASKLTKLETIDNHVFYY